jgi:hypothetical protein
LATGAALGSTVAPAAQAAVASAEVGVAPPELHAFDMIGITKQDGRTFTTVGYLTRVSGLDDALLFTRPRGRGFRDPESIDESTARFTILGTTSLRSLSTIPNQVITVEAAGTVAIYLQPKGGAHFDAPGSFGRGIKIAVFDGVFENNLTLTAPGKALVELSADLTQIKAHAFALAGRHHTFGRAGRRAQIDLSGQATLTDPAVPRSTHYFAGFAADSQS